MSTTISSSVAVPIYITPTVAPELPVAPFVLSNNDQIMPRVYTRVLLFFSPPSKETSFVTFSEIFCKAVSEILNNDYCHLFGQLSLNSDNGRLIILPNNKGIPIYIQERLDIDVSTTSWTHETVPIGLTSPSPLLKDNYEPIVQFYLTLLHQNYMCVSVIVHHAVMDGGATFDFLYRLSKLCKEKLHHQNNPSSNEILPPAVHDRTPLLITSSSSITTPLYPHQEYKIIKPTPPPDSSSIEVKPPPFVMLPMKSLIFTLTPEAAEQLKHDASTMINSSSETNSSNNTNVRISTNDAVTALIWRCVTRARTVNEKSTMLGMATNGRQRIQPPLPITYSGNANLYATSLVPTGNELVHESLYSSAVRIRAAVDAMTNDYIRSSLAYIENVENITWIQPGFHSFFGNDLAITDWSRFPLYQMDFGWSNNPIKVRLPGGNWDGLALIFPLVGGNSESSSSTGRGLEIYLGLVEENMSKLLNDKEWLAYMKKLE